MSDPVVIFGVEVDDIRPAEGEDGIQVATGVLVVVTGLNADGEERWGCVSNGMTQSARIGMLTQIVDRDRTNSLRDWTRGND